MSSTSPHALLEVLEQLDQVRGVGKSQGKRAYRRFSIRGDATITPTDPSRLGEQVLPVQMRDVGRGGVGFVCNQPLDTYTTWRLSIYQHQHMVGQQSVIVRHCRRIEDGVYLVGCQFCIDNGLMILMGVEPGQITDGDSPETCESEFETPDQVA